MGEKLTQLEALKALAPPENSVAIAISGSRRSKYVVNWALDKFIPEGEIFFKLLHVRPKIIAVPTPMGNSIPISQVRDEVATAFKKEMEWQASEKLLPYKIMCTRRQVQVEILQIESDDVANAITEQVAKGSITKLVIGASSRGLLSRRIDLSSVISNCIPRFCTVYAISKGKLSSIRPSESGKVEGTRESLTDISSSSCKSSSYNCSSQSEQADQSSTASCSLFHSTSLPQQRLQALDIMNQALLHRKINLNESIFSRSLSPKTGGRDDDEDDDDEDDDDDASSFLSCSFANDDYAASSFRSLSEEQSWTNDQASSSDFSSGSQDNINFELEKLRIELRHLRGMHAMAQREAIDASRKLNDMNKRRLEETIKFREITLKEEEAKQLAKQEMEKYEATRREADYVKKCIEREAAQKREAEAKALRETKEKEKLENALVGSVIQYQKFTWEEIKSATLSFAEDLRVGMGAYGTVYKCSLGHTTAAVKVLHVMDACRSKQFQQELEILSKIRHPHLLILLGACPDHGCLVYEFMENGSLEDRLLRKNNSLPIPWFGRLRIAWEVASALVFLHKSKPKPIVHRDLKPGNILLDRNLVSKIGDVGLSTVVHSDHSFSFSSSSSISTTSYKETNPIGTFCYIDPEYQRTGIVSPKSDVYAFGMVVLQLLTAKPPIALAHLVEKAIENDSLSDLLDEYAGQWPIEETKELAVLALRCTELRAKDRPDLKDEVLPALDKLKRIGDKAQDLASAFQSQPPNHFVCPILKEVMGDPHVAADGYTYDRKAIEAWVQRNDTSPMTNLPLPHKNLLPNYTLLSAIMDWKSTTHPPKQRRD